MSPGTAPIGTAGHHTKSLQIRGLQNPLCGDWCRFWSVPGELWAQIGLRSADKARTVRGKKNRRCRGRATDRRVSWKQDRAEDASICAPVSAISRRMIFAGGWDASRLRTGGGGRPQARQLADGARRAMSALSGGTQINRIPQVRASALS